MIAGPLDITKEDRRHRAPSNELPSVVRDLPCASHVEHPRMRTTYAPLVTSRDAPRAPVVGERATATERWAMATNCRERCSRLHAHRTRRAPTCVAHAHGR